MRPGEALFVLVALGFGHRAADLPSWHRLDKDRVPTVDTRQGHSASGAQGGVDGARRPAPPDPNPVAVEIPIGMSM